jgi:hypothetical protein
MMTLQQMKILIERNEKELPKRNQNEADNAYRRKVVQVRICLLSFLVYTEFILV